MPFIEWNEELVLGLEEIDAHHRHLVDLLNNAHDSFIWGMQPGALETTMSQLSDYADYHFAAEEQLMQQQNDPGLVAHQQEHAAFRTKILEMRRSDTTETLPAQLEMIVFLLEWLVVHIKTTDRVSLAR